MELRKVFAIVVVAVTLGLGSVIYQGGADDSPIDAALLRASLIEASADSAPQQQVAAGWLTNDLLEATARQNTKILQMQGIMAVLVAALLLAVAFSPASMAASIPSAGSHGSTIAEAEPAISDPPLSPGQVAVIPEEGLPVRKMPDATEVPWTRLAGGRRVYVLEKRGDWARVRLDDGSEAWIDNRRLLRS